LSAVLKPRIVVGVRKGRKAWEVWVQTPDGRDFLLKSNRSFSDAARAARKEVRWWQGQGYPVVVTGLERSEK